MARPMRAPVKWDRGSVSVAPIAQPFKGILEDFGIPESAYSAEGGFGGSGLLDWEPAEFISPDVVWGTKYVSGAPPPSYYKNGDDDDDDDDDKKDGCDAGFHKVGGVCVKDSNDGCDAGFHKEGGVCVKNDVDDPCKGVTCGSNQRCVNGVCVDIEVGECRPPNGCGVWPTCYPCDPGQDDTLDESDDDWYDVVGPDMEPWVKATGPEPDYGDVFDEPGSGYVPPAAVIPDISGLLDDPAIPYVPNPYVDTFTTAFPTVYGTPYEEEITAPFYDPWAFEDRRGGRR